jgi:CBS domain containing-hemolysin-like protein
MNFFYFLSYPFMVALNATTPFLLKKIGVEAVSEHDTVHSEDEIKALLRLAHKHWELSRAEHRLINAVFEFDDTVCRRIMQPRSATCTSNRACSGPKTCRYRYRTA